MRPRRWLKRAVRSAIETLSCAAMYAGSGGAMQSSLCACAWLMQWRCWIVVMDWAFRRYERAHCAQSFARCF